MYGATQDTTKFAKVLNYGTVTRYGHTFQSVRLTIAFYIVVLQPRQDKSRRFGHVPLSLATTNGIDSRSFPAVTEMFHFAAYRLNWSY